MTDSRTSRRARARSLRGCRRRSIGTVVLQRAHTLAGLRGERVDTLVLQAAAGAGATGLVLAAADGGPLSGKVPADLLVGIAGSEYFLAASAVAEDNVLAVTLASGLAAPVAAGAAVELDEEVEHEFRDAAAERRSASEVAAAGTVEVTFAYVLPRGFRDGNRRPEVGDVVVHATEVCGRVDEVETHEGDWIVRGGGA